MVDLLKLPVVVFPGPA